MRVPQDGTAEYAELLTHIKVDPGDGRSAGDQAGHQIAALATTLAMAIAGGALTGGWRGGRGSHGWVERWAGLLHVGGEVGGALTGGWRGGRSLYAWV